MSTTTRNAPWRVSQETQQAILELSTVIDDVGLIARSLRVNRQTVAAIVEQGIVCARPLRSPIRCKGCGVKIVVSPCLACEMKQRAKQLKGISV